MFDIPDFYKDFDVDLNLNEENINRCNNQSQFDAGLGIRNSALCQYEKWFNAFPPKAEYTEQQKEYLIIRAKKWRSLIEEAYNEQLRRRANFVPWNVAGLSNYNVEKANKQTERDFKNSSDWQDKISSFIQNTAEGIKRLTPIEVVLEEFRKGGHADDVVKADDPYAMDKLNARLEYLTEKQADMKLANKHYRKNGTMKGYFSSDATAEKWDAEIKNHYSWEQQPFPSYELTSINGMIKRCKARIDSITTQLATKPFEDFSFDGGQVIANYDEDRLQVIFDSKPDDDMRSEMKSNGFRWSPRFSAWQRQLTKNAYSVAEKIFKK